MDVVSPHTFIVDLEAPERTPTPSSLGSAKGKGEKIKQIDHYPKLEIEFFDTVKECAEYIDRISDINKRLSYTKRLNKIFVQRNRMLVMRLFRELIELLYQ